MEPVDGWVCVCVWVCARKRDARRPAGRAALGRRGAARPVPHANQLRTTGRALPCLVPRAHWRWAAAAPTRGAQAKTIVFVSTCKQVRFLFEAFRKLRPGVPLRALHGKMNQYKRMGGGRAARAAPAALRLSCRAHWPRPRPLQAAPALAELALRSATHPACGPHLTLNHDPHIHMPPPLPSPSPPVFYEFCEAKAMVLFATDIAARGLDFPTIDWVVQVRGRGGGGKRRQAEAGR